jgi:hypothetical protein
VTTQTTSTRRTFTATHTSTGPVPIAGTPLRHAGGSVYEDKTGQGYLIPPSRVTTA